MEEVFEQLRRSLEDEPGTKNAEVEEVEIERITDNKLKINYSFRQNFSQGVADKERQMEAIEAAYESHGLEVEADYRGSGIYTVKGEAL